MSDKKVLSEYKITVELKYEQLFIHRIRDIVEKIELVNPVIVVSKESEVET